MYKKHSIICTNVLYLHSKHSIFISCHEYFEICIRFGKTVHCCNCEFVEMSMDWHKCIICQVTLLTAFWSEFSLKKEEGGASPCGGGGGGSCSWFRYTI